MRSAARSCNRAALSAVFAFAALALVAEPGHASRRRDPRTQYPFVSDSKFLGGAGYQVGRAIARESNGLILAAGEEAAPGATHRAIFVARFGADLTVQQRVSFDGPGDRLVAGLVIDAQGDVYVSGAVQGASLPALGTGTPPIGGWDAFVMKLDRASLGVLWTAFVGGHGQDYGGRIALDAAGRVILSGRSCSTDLPTTPATAPQPSNAGGCDAFVARLAANGRAIEWCTYFGGSADENVFPFLDAPGQVAVASGSVFIVGSTESADLPVTAGAAFPSPRGKSDAFVARVDPGSTHWRYATYYGGTEADQSFAVAATPTGQAWVVGRTESVDLPVVRAFQPQIASLADAFVTRFSPDGSHIEVGSYLGGAGEGDRANGVQLDGQGHVFVVGTTRSTAFPGADPERKPGGSTNFDGFLARISDSGAMTHSWFLGGAADEDAILDVAIGAGGDVLAAGYAFSPDFPVEPGTPQSRFAEGPEAVFVSIPAARDDVECVPETSASSYAVGSMMWLSSLQLTNRMETSRSTSRQIWMRLVGGMKLASPWSDPLDLAPNQSIAYPGAPIMQLPSAGEHTIGCSVREAGTGRFLGEREVAVQCN